MAHSTTAAAPRRILGTAAALAILAAPGSARAQIITGPFATGGSYTLVPNGGFETGAFPPWSPVASAGTNPTLAVSSALPYAGTYSAQLTSTTGFNGAGFGLFQTVVLAPGTYVLSGFINTSLATTGNAYLDLNDIGGEPQVVAAPGVNAWQFTYGSFVTAGGPVTVRAVVDGNVAANQPFYFDDIAITPATAFVAPTVAAVPEPATVVLLGAGLVGVGVAARRRRG